jgi:hypothetical protein
MYLNGWNKSSKEQKIPSKISANFTWKNRAPSTEIFEKF